MIEINLYNYEEYVLDFLEDNLDSFKREAFLLFLKNNPEIKVELEFFNDEKLVPEPVLFDNKHILKKESIITQSALSNFDELCIAKVEGDLSDHQMILFDELINSNKLKKREFERFKKTIIKSDDTIVFKGKDRLKKKPIGVWRIHYSLVSIAASILIIVGLFTLLPQTNNVTNSLANMAERIEIKKDAQIVNKEVVAVSQVKQEKIEKRNTLFVNKIDIKEKITKRKIEIDEKLELDNIVEKETFEKLEAKSTFIENNLSGNIRLKEMIISDKGNYKLKQSGYLSLRSFVAKTINRNVFNKNKAKIEMFDIAQAGVKGFNRLTGVDMKLERVYDENGKLNKTEFTTKLLAFSTPSKK